MLTGENGILTQAQKAKTETEDSKEDELRRLTSLEAAMNLENKTYEDKDGQIAIIPAGFAVSQVEGENTIKDGLVIIDSKGNEFVWIPVTSEDEYVRNTTYGNKDVSATAYTDTGYLPDEIAPTIPDNVTDEKEIGLINEKSERDAVVSKGGFYISRYEAGLEGTDTLVSKKGATVWTNKTQSEFKEIGKSFEVKSPEKVKSAMCSGIQWDIIMHFINGKLDGNGIDNFLVTTYNTNRHTGSPTNSGFNEADKVCNIYDLESNYFEYSAEKAIYQNYIRIVDRGGSYDNKVCTASTRNVLNGEGYSYATFRFVLYVM